MFFKLCPECQSEINYSTKYTLADALKKNTKCKQCRCKPENNPFYGKKHTEERKKIISQQLSERVTSDETKLKLSKAFSGENNPMYQKSVVDVWIEKYGKEEADKKHQNLKEKHSKNNTGKGNPMYGKPAPNGAGNGWKGWYNDVFFRSLRELTFMLEMDEKGIKWISAEKIRIPYKDWEDKDRTYCPDFLVNKTLIEIKPIRLQNTPAVEAKTKAGKKYAEDNNLEYKIIDVTINSNLIKNNLNKIKFQDRYNEKIEIYFN